MSNQATGNSAHQPREGFMAPTFRIFVRKAFKTWFHERRQRTLLKNMLNDKRFAKGFRSTQRLADGIGADRTTTERLLLTIGAWRSEVSDEWTLSKKPPK